MLVLGRSRIAIVVLAPALGLACGSNNSSPGGMDGGREAGKDGSHPTDGKAHEDSGHPKKDGGGKDGTPPSDGSNDTKPPVDSGRDAGPGAGASVLQFHLHDSRDGWYVDPLMTPAHAAALALDTGFDGSYTGPLWGQPLYVQNGVGGNGTYYVAEDSNDVYAIDETTGKAVKSLLPIAASPSAAGSGCGNVKPVGITGTPVIDESSRTMYFVAAVGTGSAIMTQEIHAVSIDDLSEKSGWPIDVSTLTSAGGVTFNPPPQGQRSALSLVNGYVYASWGGEDGDCGNYHGWVVAVPVGSPSSATGYTTKAKGGGMWAVGGLASDGTDMFGVTGNAEGGSGTAWANFESEAILRFHDGTAFDSTNTKNYFTPSNWACLDHGGCQYGSDTDLVGAGPIVVDVAGATPSALVIAMGKSGVMHLLDKSNLGGVGTGNGTKNEGLYSAQLADNALRGAAATFTNSSGTYVVVQTDGNGTSCPGGGSGNLIAVQITATSPPTYTTVWCANSNGSGSPIVTTTDAKGNNPIVWIAGAEGSNQLYAFDGMKGTTIFSGGGVSMDNVIHWTTPIELKGKIVVGSNDKLYVFK